MVRKRPHMEILLPTENFVYSDPSKVVLKARLSRKSKVRFEIRDSIGKLVKIAIIEESELEKKLENLYIGEVKVGLKFGKYYVIGAPQTNLPSAPAARTVSAHPSSADSPVSPLAPPTAPTR